MSLDPQLGPTDKNYGRTRLGPTLKLRFVSTALQNLQLALCKMHGQWPGTEPQQGMGAEVGRSKNILEAGSPHTLYDLLVFLALFGSRRLSEIGRGGLSAGKGGSRASEGGGRTRHFSLGWCSWSRPWPRESSGPAWL